MGLYEGAHHALFVTDEDRFNRDLVAVRLLANVTEVVRATALRIRREEQTLPGTAFTPPHDMRGPEILRDPLAGNMDQTPFLSGISMRVARGSFGRPAWRCR